MATKTQTPLEARRELEKNIAAIDLDRAEKIKAIFTRPGMKTALAELQEIYDADSTSNGTAGSNVNSLIKSGITLLQEIPGHADGHIAVMQRVLNPEPVAPPPPFTPAV